MIDPFTVVGLGLAIGDAMNSAADVAPTGSVLPAADPQHLTRRVDKLSLACMAMWELIRDQTALTEEDLVTKMQEIDLRDGGADGKLTLHVRNCPACNRPVSPCHERCLYCGSEMQKETAFDGAL